MPWIDIGNILFVVLICVHISRNNYLFAQGYHWNRQHLRNFFAVAQCFSGVTERKVFNRIRINLIIIWVNFMVVIALVTPAHSQLWNWNGHIDYALSFGISSPTILNRFHLYALGAGSIVWLPEKITSRDISNEMDTSEIDDITFPSEI